MRNLGLRASAIVLASLLLLLSCEQVFTWPALAQAARPEVELPADWLAGNPLSAAALNEESLLWQRAGSVLKIKRRSASYSPE